MNGLELFNKTKIIRFSIEIRRVSKLLPRQVYDGMLEEKIHVQNRLNHQSIERNLILIKKKNEQTRLFLLEELI